MYTKAKLRKKRVKNTSQDVIIGPKKIKLVDLGKDSTLKQKTVVQLAPSSKLCRCSQTT